MVKERLVGVKMSTEMWTDLDVIAIENDVTIPELIRQSMKRVIKIATR